MGAMKTLLALKQSVLPFLPEAEQKKQEELWERAIREEMKAPTVPGCLKIIQGLKLAHKNAPRKTDKDFENLDALESLMATFKTLLRKAREGG